MLEKQVAELLAAYLSRFIEDVSAEQLEISLWSGHVFLNNVHLRADVLERIAALLHGEAVRCASPSSFSAVPNAAAEPPPSSASVHMLLAPLTVVKGVIRHLTIQVPWSSLESEPIHVQVSGMELVLGPLRARLFNAWEEQEREEAIKQQLLARYEEERQRLSGETASEWTSRSSSAQLCTGGDASGKGQRSTAPPDKATTNGTAASWFSWIWDFDRISQIAMRNVCLTLKDVSVRYEFDYDDLLPSLAKSFAVFVREVRLTTTNERFRDVFVNDLLSPLCKRIVLTDIVVSTHAMRVSPTEQPCQRAGSVPEETQRRSFSSAEQLCASGSDVESASLPPSVTTFVSAVTPPPPPALVKDENSAYRAYQDQWRYSAAVLRVSSLELQIKVIPPGCASLHPIVEDAAPLPASSMELTVSATSSVQASLSFGAFQVLESLWRSYHKSLGCARYRKQLHILRLNRHQQQSEVTVGDAAAEHGAEHRRAECAPRLVSASRQLARRRWQFAMRCVVDDIQQQRQTVQRDVRSRREVIEGMMKFCPMRRIYCEYWKRKRGVRWAPPLNALEEKSLTLMERQLSLAQVIFLRCLAYAEILQEEDGYARQRAFIEEARQRQKKRVTSSGGSSNQPAEERRGSGLWGWFARPASPAAKSDDSAPEAKLHGDTPAAFSMPPCPQMLSLVDLLTTEWELGQRYAALHCAPLVRPSVPHNLLPDVSAGNAVYFTLRCLVEVFTLRVDPTYWPLLQESSVPLPPLDTPLRRIQQKLCVRLSAVEVFFTTVSDDRPDRASWSFFVGSTRISFEGMLRSVLLQSKEADGEDFIIAKQNGCRTHIGVWIAPQLVVCQPLHEWRWWWIEATAFVGWLKAIQRAFYSPPAPPRAAAAAAVAAMAVSLTVEDSPAGTPALSRGGRTTNATPNLRFAQDKAPSPPPVAPSLPSISRAPLVWNITIQATDVCVPLFARDIEDADLDIIDHQPSGRSSLVMMDSVATAIPLKNPSLDVGAHKPVFLSEEDADSGNTQGSEQQQLSSADAAVGTCSGGGARSKNALRAFFLADGLSLYATGEDSGDDDGVVNTNSLPASVVGSFASTKPERCFLSNDACLVLSISTTRFCSVAPSRKRQQVAGNEYYLCIGSPDRAVRLFCQKGLSSTTLGTNRHLELMSFAAGEVLLSPAELSVVFNKGIDFVVEPDAFAALNDGLLKPVVFSASDADARVVQSLTEELLLLQTKARGATGGSGQLLTPSWRLRSAGCVEITRGGSGDRGEAVVLAREFSKECARYIMTAVAPTLSLAAGAKDDEVRSCDGTQERDGASKASRDAVGGRTIALGVSVARLLVRSADREDVAEIVLVAPEEIPAATAPYRGALSALGAQEPRAIELLWSPSCKLQLPTGQEASFTGEEPGVWPRLLLSIPDVTMTTAAGQKLITVEQLTVLQAVTAPNAPLNVAVTMETASACVDVVLVDLLEAAVGTYGALRLMETPQAMVAGSPTITAETQNGPYQESSPQHERTRGSRISTLSVRVRSIYLQAPLTKADVEGAPYTEVNAHVNSFNAFCEPVLFSADDQSQKESSKGSRVHLEFQVADATQVVDYTSGDPETRSLVTALPWAAHMDQKQHRQQRNNGTEIGGGNREGSDAHPLRCVVDVAMPHELGGGIHNLRGSGDMRGESSATPLRPTTCRIAVHGGALHAYFPFLYLLADVLARDERAQRLRRLPSSPLLRRGFTALQREGVPWRRDSTSLSASGTPTAYALPPALPPSFSSSSSSAPSSRSLEVTATISDVDIFLASDAAVPIDVGNPNSLCVVHVAEVRAGLVCTVVNTADPTLAARLRTHAYLDTVGLHLLDLVSAHSSHVQLPDLKVRTETGVLLVLKDPRAGYVYQRGNREDTMVQVGLHPSLPSTAAGGRDDGAAINTNSKVQASVASGGVTGVLIDLGADQCRALIRLFARNVAQPPVAAVREGKPWNFYEEAAHSLRSRRKSLTHPRQQTASGCVDDFAERPKTVSRSASSALTLLVKLPSVSLMLHASSGGDTVPGSSAITYELALRRGAQIYSASGGQWSSSPLKNVQIGGLELSAWEDAGHRGGPSLTTPATAALQVHSLFTVDLVDIALVGKRPSSPSSASRLPAPQREQREQTKEAEQGGTAVAAECGSAPSVRVAAVVRNITVRVPHVRWWLGLYMLFADSAAATDATDTARPVSAQSVASLTPLSLQDSAVVAGGCSGPSQHRDFVSSRQSSVMFGPRGGDRDEVPGDWTNSGQSRPPPTGSKGSQWLHGHVELSQTWIMLGESDFMFGAVPPSSQQQLPWCRLLIPEARLTVAPVTLPQGAGAGLVYDELTFDVPRCPEVLLRSVSSGGGTAVSAAAAPKVVYVSVLKLRPTDAAAASSPLFTTTPGARHPSSCITVQLIRSPHSHLISQLRYGRSYHMTDLTLHRTHAVQVQLRGLLLNAPATELFGFAQELLRQSAEVRKLFVPVGGSVRSSLLPSASPTRTYTGLEAQLTNVGVIISTESPHAMPLSRSLQPAAPSPLLAPSSVESPWCGVTVASIRLTTDVALENVITSTGEPATLMDDTLSDGWRMRVWHLVSDVALRGVVIAGHHGADAEWRVSRLDFHVSQPLLRAVMCVRAVCYTSAGDEPSQRDSEPPSVELQQGSSTDFFRVEPTKANACSELKNHLITRVMVEVGETENQPTKEEEGGAKEAAVAASPVVVSIGTAYTISRSVAHMLQLWRTTGQKQREGPSEAQGASLSQLGAAVAEAQRDVAADLWPLPADGSPDPTMWYELKLSLRGRRLSVVSDIPPGVPHAAARHNVLTLTLEDAVTFHTERELIQGKEGATTGCLDEERESNDSLGSTASAIAAEGLGATTSRARAVICERYRMRVGAVRVLDGVGNLIFLLSSSAEDTMAGASSAAATIEYESQEGALRIEVDHVLLDADAVMASFAVEWVRACQTWTRLWTTIPLVTFAELEDGHELHDNDQAQKKEADGGNTLFSFLRVFAEVRQAEVRLAPAGYVVIQRPQLSCTLAAEGGDVTATTSAGKVRQLRCDNILLYSTSAVGCQSTLPKQKCNPELLAAVTSPLLRCTRGAHVSATVCRVPRVSLYNRDGYNWALCTMRVAAVLRSVAGQWSSTRVDEHLLSSVSAVHSSPPSGPRDLPVPKEVADEAASSAPFHASTFQLLVEHAEVLCFAPHDELASGCAAPALHFHAYELDVAVPATTIHSSATAVTTAALEDIAATPTRKLQCRAAAKLSATYRSSTATAAALSLLEETEATVYVCSQPLQDEQGEEEGGAKVRRAAALSEVRVCVAERGLVFRLPTDDALESVASALELVVGQHVPRRSSKAPTPSLHPPLLVTVESAVPWVRSQTGRNHVTEKGKRRWGFSAYVPRLSFEFNTAAEQRLAAVEVSGISGRMEPRAETGQRPFVEICVGEVTGETDVSERDDSADSATRAAACFLSMEPLIGDSLKKPSPDARSSGWKAASADVQRLAFFLEQRLLLLSLDDSSGVCGDAAILRSRGDEATVLTVRLNVLHTHVTLAFAQAFMSSVLKPIVRGVRHVVADANDPTILQSFYSTVLRVTHPDTPLPPFNELERHAALVRVVKVSSDWTLTHDLVLGGSEGSACGMQLHFCDAAPHNVITVRGDSTAAKKGGITVHLSCCECINGDVSPAIRVDSDLTVKFENVRVVVAAVAGGGDGQTPSPDAFVMLGERALCVFPAPSYPSSLPSGNAAAEASAGKAAGEYRTNAVTDVADVAREKAAGAPTSPSSSLAAAPSWASTSIYSIDVKMGFDTSLTVHRSSLSAAGAWQVRYRLEDNWRGQQVVRTEHEGEATLTLQRCASESNALTRTPVVFAARISYANNQGSRMKLTFDLGNKAWRLPLAHARMLVAVAQCAMDAFAQPSTAHAAAAAWVPPTLTKTGDQKAAKAGASSAALNPPLDVDCETARWTLCLTNDLQQSIVSCNVEQFVLHCTSDLQFTDAVLHATAVLSVTDRLPPFNNAGATDVTRNGASPNTSKASTAPTPSPAAPRVIFAAKPSVTLVWTRFSADSRSLSLSVNVEDVVATLPIMTAIRFLRRAHTDLDADTHVFWNDSGVQLTVAAAPEPPTASAVDTEPDSRGAQWRVSGSPTGVAVVTGISSTVAELTLTPESSSTGAPLLPVTLDLRSLTHDAAHRLCLPNFASPCGALDLVVRRHVCDGMAGVHLTTTVKLTNAFYSLHDASQDGSRSAAMILRGPSSSNEPDFVIAARSTRFVPLPVLGDQLRLEMDGCVFAPHARLLTWAMLADALTVMADQVAASSFVGGATASAASSVASLLQKLSDDEGDVRCNGYCGPALRGRQVRVLDSSTISFPVLLRPPPLPSVSGSTEMTASSASPPASPISPEVAERAIASTSPTSRVVQLTWKRHNGRQLRQRLFLGQLLPYEYTVTVEPVWTLWNWTGCRLRLRLSLPRGGSSSGAISTAGATAVRGVPEESAPDDDVVGFAMVESGSCFQWVPTSLRHLEENVSAYLQVEAPLLSASSSQWWSLAAPLFLRESPPPFVRLQQGGSRTRGAVLLEQHSSSTVVVRCAALLRSEMAQPVYLRDAARPLPVLGTDAQGCLEPQQVLPLFFSEYATTLAPNAKKVGFTVRDKPLHHAAALNENEETDAYYVTSPIAATVLSAKERDNCTAFYSVSASTAPTTAVDGAAELGAPESSGGDTSLWRPPPPATLRLRCLCAVRNTDTRRTLFIRPSYVREGDSPVATVKASSAAETRVPPGEEREVLQFGAYADEPEVNLRYGDDADTRSGAHLWSPPVKLLSLATSTVPLVLKHVCAPTTPAAEGPADAFCLFPVTRAHEATFVTCEYYHCLALQSSTDSGRLCVSASLYPVPPLRIINRLNTTLEFAQMLKGGGDKDTASLSPSSPPPAVTVSANGVSTALCSRTARPRSYLVAAETTSYGCWEVPTLDFRWLRIILNSNRPRGLTVSVDVDLLKCAAAPSSGLRVGQTNAYIYVSLDHVTRQYIVTIISTQQLESSMLLQPRRLTQLEVFVPRCTLYVAAVTLPVAGPFSRASVVARCARGRLRTRGKCGDGAAPTAAAVVPATATDDDVLTLLRQLEVDVLCVRTIGVYGSVIATEQHLLGNASVGIVEVMDCTAPDAVYPVVFRMSSLTTAADRGGCQTSPDEDVAVAQTSAGSEGDTAAARTASSFSLPTPCSDADVTAEAAAVAGVPRFNNPFWCNVEVRLTRSSVHTGSTVMVPVQLLRISVPPMVVHLHDEFLFALRASVESVHEALSSTKLSAGPRQPTSVHFSQTVQAKGLSAADARRDARRDAAQCASKRTVYNVFLYELHISAIATEITYTRADDRRYNPFRGLGMLSVNLIPSMEGLGIQLREVRLANVELLSATSLARALRLFVWPLYRTQLLLQSYKVVGSLDVLGNPRALLGSWSRGMWDLVANASSKSRWARTRDFLRTTTSSTLHSVGAVARSIGSLTGGAGVLPTADLRRGVFGEVLAEVGGGVADAVAKPLQGAREGGVNGFFLGVASGVVGLVGRPVFGFFRGVGVTSEFYARLLRGQTTLAEDEARRLALERNYRLPSDCGDNANVEPGASGAAGRLDEAPLAATSFEQVMADIPRWRRSDETSVRAAVMRVGVRNAALFIPYASVSTFFTPEEFAQSLPTSLTVLLATKLLYLLTYPDARHRTAPDREGDNDDSNHHHSHGGAAGGNSSNGLLSSRLARECERASHIKTSLGVSALRKYVSGDVFACVCSLAEMEESVTAAELQANYVALLAKVVSAAGEELFTP